MAVTGVISVTGTICQFFELDSVGSRNGSATIGIRQADGRVLDIDNLVVTDENRPELEIGNSGTFHLRTYAPAHMNFLLASERDGEVRLFQPVSALYLLGLVLAIVAANVMTLPVCKVILERFFTSTMSRLVFSCIYIGILGYAIYILFEIGQLYRLASRLRRVLAPA